MTVLGNDTAVRANQSGLGTASDGRTYTTTGTGTFSVASNELVIVSTLSDSTAKLGSNTSIDIDVTVRMSINSLNDICGILTRYTGGNNGYKFLFYSGGIHINKQISGTNSQLTSVGFSPAINTFYWFRFRCIGSSVLEGSIWADGASPTTATITTLYGDTSIPTAGGFGVLVNTNTGSTGVQFDHFYAVDYPSYAIQQLSSFSAQGSASSAANFTTTITERLTTFSAQGSTATSVSLPTSITERLTSFAATASASGTQSQIAQLASFTAIAGVSSSIPLPSTPGVSVLLGTNPAQHVLIREGSFEIDDSINQVSTCSFTVRDDSGENHFQKGQAVLVNDHLNGLMFTGVVNTSEEDNVRPNPLTMSKIDAQDNHWFPGKRTYQGPEYTEEYAGVIACDLLNVLADEGVTAQYASRRETTQGQFALGTLSNTIAANNVGAGDLELAPAGSIVTIVEETTAVFGAGTLTNVVAANNTLTPTPITAIKMTGTMNVANLANAAVFYLVWAGSYVIQSNDALGYYVWVSPDSPEAKATVDLVCSDGSRLQDQNVGGGLNYSDENDLPPGAGTDLAGYADGKWYYRFFSIKGFVGKTLSYAAVALGGQKTGDYTAYFRNIRIYNGTGGATQVTIFNGSLASTQQLQTNGYENTLLFLTPTYNLQDYAVINIPVDSTAATVTYGDAAHERISTAYSVAAAVLLKQSMISWQATEPANTKVVIRVGLDNAVPVECTNNSSIPNLLPGMNLAGRTLKIYQDFYRVTGASVEDTPVLQALQVTLTSAPSCTKTDKAYTTVFSSGEAGASFSSTIANNGILNLTGATRTWDLSLGTARYIVGSASYADDQTAYLGTAGQTIFQRAYEFGNPSAGNESKTRLDFAGQHQNFVAELDVQLLSDIQIGLAYRSTNLSANNGSYAYAVMLSETGILLKKGTNTTGGGSPTTLATNGFVGADKSWHRLKVVVSGTSHLVYVDNLLLISLTDSTYSATGYLGVFGVSATQAYPTYNFDNFGVVDASIGTWTSPSISLNSIGTYGSSIISWRDRSMSPASNNTTEVAISLDNGVTYWSMENGTDMALDVILGSTSLIGVSMKVQVTLLTSTAQSMPGIDNLSLLITGAYSSSGTRIGPALSLLSAGRLGGSVVAWNATLLTGAALGVDTSIDNAVSWQDVTAQNGGSIPGLTGQPEPTIDGFDTNTSASYSNVSLSGVLYSLRTFGGPVPLSAAWTYDTANSRIIASGAGRALYVYNPLTGVSDVDLLMYSEHCDAGGLTWRYTNAANHYELIVQDDTSSEDTPNSAAVYKVSSGTRTLLASSSISFPRGTPHISRVTMIASVITLYFDGLQILTVTDGSPLGAGKCGLMTGGGVAHFYQLRIQPLGQDVTALSVLTRWRLATSDPTVTPQVLSTALAAYGNTIATGALIPKTNYNLDYLSNNFDDLVKQNSSATGNQWWWSLDRYKIFSMLPQTGILAPWVGSSSGLGDFLDADLRVTNQSDLYRNRQIIKNVLDTVAVDESRVGDGKSTSWTFGNQWAAAPVITVNGAIATVGIKNVDTGRQFYYAVGDATITEDSSGQVYGATQTIRFVGTGQFTTYSQYDDLNEQAAFQLIEGGSGIVENVEDGAGITKAAGDQLAKARVMQYGIRGRQLVATTRRYGLAPGQLLPIFLPEHGITDGLFLIRSVRTKLTTEYDPVQGAMIQHGWWTIDAIEGADLGDWTRLFKKV